jgi:multiple sugar transport system substrate-binding protein
VWDEEDLTFGPIAKRFRAKYPKITLTSINTGGDAPFVQKVTTMAAGGAPPDLMVQTTGRMIALGPTGVYEDLAPRIEVSSLMQRIIPQLPGKAASVTFLGKQYGIPYSQNFNLWFYNKDIFDQKGVAYPAPNWTWNDVVDLGQKITDPKANLFFVDPGTTSFNNLSDRFWANGTTIFSEDFRHLNFDLEPNIQALEFWVGLYAKHKICPSPELKLGDMGFSFDTGKMAMARTSNGNQLPVQLGPKPTWAFKWSATLPPAGPKAQVTYNSLGIFCLGKGAKNADLAWQLLTWGLDDEEQTAQAKAGSTVARADILKAVTIPGLPDHLQATMKAVLENTRSHETCPGWSACQTIYNQEMAPAYLGRITAQEGAANTYKKGQPALENVMKQLGLM